MAMANLVDCMVAVSIITTSNAAKTRILVIFGCSEAVIKLNKMMRTESTDNEREVLIHLLLECCGAEGE